MGKAVHLGEVERFWIIPSRDGIDHCQCCGRVFSVVAEQSFPDCRCEINERCVRCKGCIAHCRCGLPDDYETRADAIVRATSHHGINVIKEHIEMLAASYLLKTGIPPEDVELVTWADGSETAVYFRRRTDDLP